MQYSNVNTETQTGFTCTDLADLLTPANLQSSPWSAFHDLSAIRSGGSLIPRNRSETGYFINNEDYWIREICRRIEDGTISATTLVVTNSGHGLTIAYEMCRLLGSDVYMQLPQNALDRYNVQRIRSQAQSFGPSIASSQERGRKGCSTLMYVDGHATNDTVSNLPPVSSLLGLGIKTVFMALEKESYGTKRPFEKSAFNSCPLHSWLGEVAKEIEVFEDGVDARPPSFPVCRESFDQHFAPMQHFAAIPELRTTRDTKIFRLLMDFQIGS